MAGPGGVGTLGACGKTQTRIHHGDLPVVFERECLQWAVRTVPSQYGNTRERFATTDGNLETPSGIGDQYLAVLQRKHLIIGTASLAGVCL